MPRASATSSSCSICERAKRRPAPTDCCGFRDTTGNNLLVRLFGLPGFRHLLRVGYEAISYNRRIISPPRNQIVCDCEPEATFAHRLTLIVPVLLFAVLLVALFGATAFHAGELGDALTAHCSHCWASAAWP